MIQQYVLSLLCLLYPTFLHILGLHEETETVHYSGDSQD